MDDNNNEQRPRASLRGRGREILLGQQSDIETPGDVPAEPDAPPETPDSVDAEALHLTPEETTMLLDFSPSSPAYDAQIKTPAPRALPEEPKPAVEDDLPLPDYDFDQFEEAPPPIEEALPLSERYPVTRTYRPLPAVENLIPTEPEIWQPEPEPEPVISQPLEHPPLDFVPVPAGDEHEGGLVVPEGAVLEESPAEGLTDPFQPVLRRQSSASLFEKTSEPDASLLDKLVDDNRIRKLWQQIEELQEELVEQVHGERGSTDVYQDELLQASSLLLESRANYDDARAIVYRIRADLKRQQKVHDDIMRYRPLLLNYYLGWGIALAVLVVLKSLFSGVMEAVGVANLAALYYPTMLGIAGALISGYLTLDRHTTKLRDFDPMHISWYLFNPLLGGVMGLLMFLLASIANGDLLEQKASEPELAIAYLLCVVAGMNQNSVLGQMNDLLKRFGNRGS